MSAQTGIEVPPGPASQRLGDRVGHRLRMWRDQPNALWLREMRQSARLTRTPLVLMVLTILMTLLASTIGAAMTGSARSPAQVGELLFHTYFSLAFFVVTLVGPALAANTIASEREGRTWEAVLLTGMRPAEVARGKFLSAYTAISMYVVMLAPVGAVPFLFGGITPVEVLVAFVFLFAIALLSVAFGLAISAKMDSLRGALLVTLLAAVPLSLFAFSVLGVGLSEGIHELWDVVDAGGPVWLPAAMGRAPFGAEYVIYLVALPTVAIVLPAWLLYEVTLANLRSVTDDRSYGVKRWYIAASAILTLVAMVPMYSVSPRDFAPALIVGMGGFCLFLTFGAFLLGGEPLGPSRRVQRHLAGRTALRRFLGPGLVRSAQLQQLSGGTCLVVLAAVGIFTLQMGRAVPRADEQTEQLVVFTLYALGFGIFVVGLSAYLRARATNAAVPRVILLVVLFLVAAGPWIVAVITGVLTRSSNEFGWEFALASPSPFYVFIALEALERPDPGVAVMASVTVSVLYAALGLAFVGVAAARCKKLVSEHATMLARADERLAREDEEAAAQRAQAEADARAYLEQPLGLPGERTIGSHPPPPGEDGPVFEIGQTYDAEGSPPHEPGAPAESEEGPPPAATAATEAEAGDAPPDT